MPEPDASGDVQGVPVWRCPTCGKLSPHQTGANVSEQPGHFATDGRTCFDFRPTEPHVAHSLAAEAQAARREAARAAIFDLITTSELDPISQEIADAVLRVLGLAS